MNNERHADARAALLAAGPTMLPRPILSVVGPVCILSYFFNFLFSSVRSTRAAIRQLISAEPTLCVL